MTGIGRWVRRIAVAGAIAMVPFVAIAGAAVADRFGPTRALIDAIERQVGPNDPLHYEVHRVLGKVLSFCPCTTGLSSEQYRRAAFHGPRPSVPPPTE